MNSKNYFMALLTSQLLASNYLSILGGVSQTHFNLTPPIESGFALPSQGVHLGLNLEQFVQPNLSFSFETTGSLSKNKLYKKRHPQISASVLSSYYLSPGSSFGAGINITHTPFKDHLIFKGSKHISHFNAANGLVFIKSAINETSYLRFELLTKSFLPAHQHDTFTSNELILNNVLDYIKFSQPGFRINFGYQLKENIFDQD